MSASTSRISVPFNDLSRAARADHRAHEAASRVVRSGWYLLGPETEAFEEDLKSYLDVAHAITVASGTDALELAFAGLGLEDGDEVVVPANGGGYAPIAARARRLSVRYADVDDENLLLSVDSLAEAVTPLTRAVVVTHLYGQMAPIADLVAYCHARDIRLVEDCAQAIGARTAGGAAGAFGDVAAFSFYPTKNLGALGDGGAVVTSDDAVARRVRSLRQYGWQGKYVIELAGGRNSRMDEVQAAVLAAKLPALDDANERRRRIYAQYVDALAGSTSRMVSDIGSDFVAHLAVMRTSDRDALARALGARSIGTQVHYPLPDHRQDIIGDPDRLLPVAERSATEILSLPCFPEMTDGEVATVADALTELVSGRHD